MVREMIPNLFTVLYIWSASQSTPVSPHHGCSTLHRHPPLFLRGSDTVLHLPLLWPAQMSHIPLVHLLMLWPSAWLFSYSTWALTPHTGPLSYIDIILTLLRLWRYGLGCPSHTHKTYLFMQLGLWISAPPPSWPHWVSRITGWAGPPPLLLHLPLPHCTWTVQSIQLFSALSPPHTLTHSWECSLHPGKATTLHSGALQISPPSGAFGVNSSGQNGKGEKGKREENTGRLQYTFKMDFVIHSTRRI